MLQSRGQILQHLRTAHTIALPEEQVPVLIDISERSVDVMEIASCPLCPDERRICKLSDHVAEHLESLALFVLPTGEHADGAHMDDDDGGSSGNAVARSEASRFGSSCMSRMTHWSQSHRSQSSDISDTTLNVRCQHPRLASDPTGICAECKAEERVNFTYGNWVEMLAGNHAAKYSGPLEATAERTHRLRTAVRETTGGR